VSAPINLNKVRKARAKIAKTAMAASNAVAFGQSRSEKLFNKKETSRRNEILDGFALETPQNSAEDRTKKP
jgi:hypothetical protein